MTSQRRTRRVTTFVSPETFQKLEDLAERLGGLSHSSVVTLAITKLYRNESVKTPKKSNHEVTR